jgi:glyoxylase-like metal-dependent hydrolase (beta-lactamase superfamily II)
MPQPRPIDVKHLGREHVICCWQVGDVLIDPGPGSTLDALLAALGDTVPKALLLTHIHLDHAGASGALAERFPDLQVYVHEVGAPHMADPSRLLNSAGRLYGDDMDRLWGETLPVPEDRIHALQGGEEIFGFRVVYTPGHAWHHVTYRQLDGDWAFTGDVAGVRIEPTELVIAPTPPPEIDVERWRASIDEVEGLGAAHLGLTHFGAVHDVPEHLARLRHILGREAELARDNDQDGFVAALGEELRRQAPDDAPAYIQAAPLDQLWQGLDRYWRKRQAA